MLRGHIYFQQIRGCFGCYVVTSISGNLQDALYATTCNIHSKLAPGCAESYGETSVAINFQDVLDAKV